MEREYIEDVVGAPLTKPDDAPRGNVDVLAEYQRVVGLPFYQGQYMLVGGYWQGNVWNTIIRDYFPVDPSPNAIAEMLHLVNPRGRVLIGKWQQTGPDTEGYYTLVGVRQ